MQSYQVYGYGVMGNDGATEAYGTLDANEQQAVLDVPEGAYPFHVEGRILPNETNEDFLCYEVTSTSGLDAMGLTSNYNYLIVAPLPDDPSTIVCMVYQDMVGLPGTIVVSIA